MVARRVSGLALPRAVALPRSRGVIFGAVGYAQDIHKIGDNARLCTAVCG
jgi:hypothetical protein